MRRAFFIRPTLQFGLRFLAGLLVVLLLGVALLTCYGYVIESQAAALLKDVLALKAGTSTGTEAIMFAKEHTRQVFQASSSCDANDCARIFRVQNTWLSRLAVEPPAFFEVNFSVKNGIVTTVGAYLFRAMPIFPTFAGSAGYVTETVKLPQRWLTPAHYYFPTPVGKPYLRVAVDSYASPNVRQRAFHFSFVCLVKPGGGCDLPCDYLPSAWQDWKASLSDADPRETDFERHYPKNGRCKP